MTQAAVLFSGFTFPGEVNSGESYQSARQFLPDHIGIWYDYACLPQQPRTPPEEAEFRQALLMLPDLYSSQAVSLVALREAGDDYFRRGWCVAEALTATSGAGRSVALRIDLMGKPLNLDEAGRERNPVVARRLQAALEAWGDTAVDSAAASDCLTMLALAAGHSQSEWFSRSDDISPVHLGEVVNVAAKWLGFVLARVGLHQGKPVDFAAMLRDLAKSADLWCALEDDLVYVVLLMLLWEAAPDTTIRKFYADCIECHVSGRPLVVHARQPCSSYEDLSLEGDRTVNRR
jgi:hypothetical protein